LNRSILNIAVIVSTIVCAAIFMCWLCVAIFHPMSQDAPFFIPMLMACLVPHIFWVARSLVAHLQSGPRRWIYRGLFVIPLCLCIVIWPASYVGDEISIIGVYYGSHAMSIWGHRGELEIDITYLGEYARYDWPEVSVLVSWTNEYNLGRRKTVAGFLCRYFVRPGDRDGFYELLFPLWFPALLLTLATVWVWRKTSPKQSYGAFPVVLDSKSDNLSVLKKQ
jgi:hypothetical protein